MRPSEASARVVLAGLAFENLSVKNGIGPKIGRGANSIGAAAARAAGVIVDSNGRMRCPAIGNTSGEFTDITQSNCILETPVEIARSARKLGDIPNSMRRLRNLRPRYKPTKRTKRSVNDPVGDSASTYWAGRLGNGLPLEAVPDASIRDHPSPQASFGALAGFARAPTDHRRSGRSRSAPGETMSHPCRVSSAGPPCTPAGLSALSPGCHCPPCSPR